MAGTVLGLAWRKVQTLAKVRPWPLPKRHRHEGGPRGDTPQGNAHPPMLAVAPEDLPGLLAAVVAQSDDVIFVTDTEGRIQFVNPAFEAVTGFRFAEVVGQTARVLKSGQQNADFYRSLWAVVKEGRVWKGTYPNRTKDGLLYFVENTVSPLRDGTGRITHYLSVQKDVTEHHEMTQRLHQQERLELVGRMAEGVAHDFRNILQIIEGNAELLRLQYPEEGAQGLLKNVLIASNQGQDLVQRLLTFGRPSAKRRLSVRMDELVRNFSKLLMPSIPAAVHAAWTVEPGLPEVEIDPVELQQALMNLCLNAIQAMPQGGELAVAVRHASLPGRVATTGTLLGGDYLDISVADTGEGIDSAIVAHIFKPFFTTKGDQGGTGLGLATVYQIVSGLGGQIDVTSQRNAGTRFQIYLPLAGVESPREESSLSAKAHAEQRRA